ncbi:hypothetical protein [Pseudomonas sp. GM17]|uniref:hypothetical protein n=1 Tax=Pseudomonas sp. GM17 TaxID=1144323 RepID=UPI00027244BC|nr:hypothetical protein [Pseudomonas sp. GM17]WIE49815.1 hypothetical protein PMI20_029605 [Pseudomonas sp. GM17]
MSKAPSRASQVVVGVKTLHALLVQIIQRPLQFNKEVDLRIALKSQGSLAKFECSIINDQGEAQQTFAMSLNTLKAHANENLVGGFKALNDLRLKALESLDYANKQEQYANKRSKSGLTRKVEQLEQELQMHRKTNIILLRALSEAIGQFNGIRDASNDNIRSKRTQDALQTLRAIVSMGMPPFNVIPNSLETLAPSTEVSHIDDFRRGK